VTLDLNTEGYVDVRSDVRWQRHYDISRSGSHVVVTELAVVFVPTLSAAMGFCGNPVEL
jgi:hypothetical protein